MPGFVVESKKCKEEDCEKTYRPHYWGSMAAWEQGWFLQRNGDAWCPDHLPPWVAEWRRKKQQ